MPLSPFRSYTAISIASNEHTVWRGHSQEVKKGINSFSGIGVQERDCPRLPEDAAVLAAPPLGDFRERFYCDRVSMPSAPQDMGNPHSVGRSYCGHARLDTGIP